MRNYVGRAFIPQLIMTFHELGLDESILKSIDEFGFKEPTPIQAGSIPHILKGRDVIGSAQTVALARLLPTRCPSCIDSEATSKARRLVASCLAPLASSLLRSRISLLLTVNIVRQSAASSTVVSATANRSTRLKKVRMSSLRHRVVYSTICNRRILTSNQSKSLCLTRSTGCSTWASLTTFSALSKCATRTGRPSFFCHGLGGY